MEQTTHRLEYHHDNDQLTARFGHCTVRLNSIGSGPSIKFGDGERVMPYRTNGDLPPSVQRHLPPHAQDIYREAFNHAFAAHMGDPRQEEAAHRIAWAAVKRSYVKIGESWIRRGNDEMTQTTSTAI